MYIVVIRAVVSSTYEIPQAHLLRPYSATVLLCCLSLLLSAVGNSPDYQLLLIACADVQLCLCCEVLQISGARRTCLVPVVVMQLCCSCEFTILIPLIVMLPACTSRRHAAMSDRRASDVPVA